MFYLSAPPDTAVDNAVLTTQYSLLMICGVGLGCKTTGHRNDPPLKPMPDILISLLHICQNRQDTAKICQNLPRTCHEPAMNLPRTCREPCWSTKVPTHLSDIRPNTHKANHSPPSSKCGGGGAYATWRLQSALGPKVPEASFCSMYSPPPFYLEVNCRREL